MPRNYHLCLDIRGVLLGWKDRQFRGVFLEDDGREMTPRRAKMFLMDELAKGRKVLPCVPCDNFDYQHGCGGHEVPAEQEAPECGLLRK